MIPPAGFRAEQYPLWHKIKHSIGINALDATRNSAMIMMIRHYKTTSLEAKEIEVNPHNVNYQEETGTVCQKMSIIKNFKLGLKFNITESARTVDKNVTIKLLWRPIFFTFGEKLDAADDDIGTTVATALSLVKDATQEDVTPLFNNTKFSTVGTSDLAHPVSTVNLNEVFGELNMDTDLTSEGVDWDEDQFQNMLRRYTNKGALRACVGKTRYLTLSGLSGSSSYRSYQIRGVPRAIRRIMPYSFFAILVHIPLSAEIGQVYHDLALTTLVPHVGVKAICTYEEWNSDHYQDMSGTGVESP